MYTILYKILHYCTLIALYWYTFTVSDSGNLDINTHSDCLCVFLCMRVCVFLSVCVNVYSWLCVLNGGLCKVVSVNSEMVKNNKLLLIWKKNRNKSLVFYGIKTNLTGPIFTSPIQFFTTQCLRIGVFCMDSRVYLLNHTVVSIRLKPPWQLYSNLWKLK